MSDQAAFREVSYVLRFRRPSKDAPTVAHGLVTITALGDGVLATRRVISSGASASYESDYKLDPDGIHFTESGQMTFGDAGSGDTLAFSTIGTGVLLPPADPRTGMTRGIVMWNIDSGSGFFEGATGLIASNFRVNLTTEALVDDQVATIWLPADADAAPTGDEVLASSALEPSCDPLARRALRATPRSRRGRDAG